MHSYAKQYVITALGRIVPMVFSVCKKEAVHLGLGFISEILKRFCNCNEVGKDAKRYILTSFGQYNKVVCEET
jgi:hypothetical protein